MKRTLILTIALLSTLCFGNVFAAGNEASLELKPSVKTASQGDEVEMDLILKNPGARPVISVRSWLQYDPSALEGVQIVTQDSPFTLSAPGEDGFDPTEGHVKIGRSNISGGVTDVETVVATIRFKVKTASKMTTLVEPYDYQVSELGHVSVNIIEAGFPLNILSEEPEDAELNLNPNGVSSGGNNNNGSDEPIGGNDNQNDNPPVVIQYLDRPENLKIKTDESGTVYLKWDMKEDEPNRAGYNVYYGKTSGQYSRRRSVGNVSSDQFDNLNYGEAYYFAITAYDQANRESDYSDEVGIIVGEPLSTTSPFEGFLDDLLAKVPRQPENGAPLAIWLALSAAGMGGSFLLRNKKNKK